MTFFSTNRSFYSCFLSDQPGNGCEASADLALIQTSLLLSYKSCCCNSNYSTLTLEKHKGLYRNRVTCCLDSILRPGIKLSYNCIKMVYSPEPFMSQSDVTQSAAIEVSPELTSSVGKVHNQFVPCFLSELVP